jgi:hypothetical protein
MTARVGFTLHTLRALDAAACETDVRLVWKDSDCFNIGIVQPREAREDWDTYFIQKIRISSARELRLLGLQLIRHADNLEHVPEEFEVVLK